MSMIKKITSGKPEILKTCEGDKDCPCMHKFAKGTKFSMSNFKWIISELESTDNVDLRHMVNTQTGDIEIRSLASLIRDLDDGLIELV